MAEEEKKKSQKRWLNANDNDSCRSYGTNRCWRRRDIFFWRKTADPSQEIEGIIEEK